MGSAQLSLSPSPERKEQDREVHVSQDLANDTRSFRPCCPATN